MLPGGGEVSFGQQSTARKGSFFTVNLFKILHYFEQFYSVLGSKVLPGEGRWGLGSKVLPGEGRWGLGSKVLPGEGRLGLGSKVR